MISSSFWNGKRVFVTGHTGFKGSWLALMLQRLNARVSGYALAPPTNPSLFERLNIGAMLNDSRGDIADIALLRAAVDEADPEIIIHMAAQPLVRWGYADPIETYRTNVMGTVNVLEAARYAPALQAAVVVTTDKCYENNEWAWGYRETDRLGGRDPYSNSKACAELVASAFSASFHAERGVKIVTARAGNVIGGGDFAADRILPDAARAFTAGRALDIRSPHAIRPWQHVLEPLYGYLLLAEHAASRKTGLSSAFNFGPGADSEKTVAELLQRFCAGWGGNKGFHPDGKQHPHEATLLRLDTSRARTELGWAPLLGFEEAVAWTAEWYRTFATRGDVARLTFDQADRYMGQCVRLTSPFTAPDIKEDLHEVRRSVAS